MIRGRALSSLTRSILVLVLTPAMGTAAGAQTRPEPGADSITIVPGPEYHAGGLKPTKKGGGFQTKGLRLKAADGRVYQFRSVDK
ncbi:MAG: hypothetical protein ABI647_21355, partial [Gemmatimonadota bacterium]